MIKLNEVVIVEGKYDKVKLNSIVDGLVIETNGFRIFNDKEKLNLIRRLAVERGIVILTDSDNAGFMIRNFLSSSINKGSVFHAYIPDKIGKEKRKSKFSSEGKIGVEGIDGKIIEKSILESGIKERETDFCNENKKLKVREILYSKGYLGGRFSRLKRDFLKKTLDLPENISSKCLIELISNKFNIYELDKLLNKIEKGFKNAN